MARDPITLKAAPINQLRLDTDEERRLFTLGSEAKSRKQTAAKLSLQKKPPSAEEVFN